MNQGPSNQQTAVLRRDENRIHKFFIWTLLFMMTIEWMFLLYNRTWLSLFLVTLIIGTLLAPHIFRKQMEVQIPAEFHLMAVIFTFAALYLGEIREFYERFWWWDIALHATAGLMMGILGFLMVYILNETKRVSIRMKPGFIALFAFTFAVTIGTLWEIFEFGMDQAFGLNMQKPMWDDPSGLTDTMLDMIVNAIGALLISITGWWYLKNGKDFFIKSLIHRFIKKNPEMFRK
jgi:hypothetical protein